MFTNTGKYYKYYIYYNLTYGVGQNVFD